MASLSIPYTTRASAIPVVWSPRASAATFGTMPEREASDEDAYLLLLGNAIQRIRKRLLGVNQETLGERVGRDKNTISRWEGGKTSLSAYDLRLLWQALGVPAEWMLDPPDSITALERRVQALQRAASEAARDETGEGPDQPSDGGRASRRGRS
jgi:transcriptional regulator with XRE-family HTH domain